MVCCYLLLRNAGTCQSESESGARNSAGVKHWAEVCCTKVPVLVARSQNNCKTPRSYKTKVEHLVLKKKFNSHQCWGTTSSFE